jgi:hypothetical protein
MNIKKDVMICVVNVKTGYGQDIGRYLGIKR